VTSTSPTTVRVSSDRFLELVEISQLVPTDAVRRVRAALRDSLSGEIAEDPQRVAAAFVEAKLLTQWQAGMLLRGKHKGFQLGKYRLLEQIGSGGMSRVYLAEHLLMRRRVAIKVLPPARVDDSSYLARFRREAEAVAQLDHPNIVRAFDIDQEGNTHYFVMEYIDGHDFLQIVTAEGPLEYRRAAEYIAQVADALHHAHGAGLIHRDIKPGNCLVEHGGTVKLLDLGLAKFMQETGPSLTLMHEENVLGTADYLAPEQARNSHSVDHRADIYSLGCTLYFLLTGHAPFPRGSLSERLIKHQTAEPEDIRQDRPDVPQRLVDICSKMMEKAADKRFQDAGDVAKDLRDWLGSGAPGREADESRGGPFGDVWHRAARPQAKPAARPASKPSSPSTRQSTPANGRTRATDRAKPSADATANQRGAETKRIESPRDPTDRTTKQDPNAGAGRVSGAEREPAPRDVPLLPHLPPIELELGEEHAWEAGSRFLPRRSTLSDSQRKLWIGVGVVSVVALLVLVIGALLFAP
jgi:eukaryotic-like serine/threonine-protein kinase